MRVAAVSVRRHPVVLVVITAFVASPVAVRSNDAWAGSAWAGPAWAEAWGGSAGTPSTGSTASYGDPFGTVLWGAGPPWWHPQPVPSVPASKLGAASL
jgi:hypothetical protein